MEAIPRSWQGYPNTSRAASAACPASSPALLLSSISTAINIIGLEPQYMQVIRGGLMLVAVLLDSIKGALRRCSE